MKLFCIGLLSLGLLGSLSASRSRNHVNHVDYSLSGTLSLHLDKYRFEYRHNIAVIANHPSYDEQIKEVRVYRMANDNETDAEEHNEWIERDEEESETEMVRERWKLLLTLAPPSVEYPCYFYVDGDYAITDSGIVIDLTQPEGQSLLQELKTRYAPGNRPWELPDPAPRHLQAQTDNQAVLPGGCCNIQ